MTTAPARRDNPTVGVEQLLDALLAKLDLETRVRLLTGASMWTMHADPTIGLRPMVTSDEPVGVRGLSWDERDSALLAPSPTALAATWNLDLVSEVARLLATECRRKGVDILLAPTLNLHRSPLGGRHFECFSEDPRLIGAVAASYVRGLQAGGVAAAPKHYVANDSETERMTLDARVDERTMREVYLAPFEDVVVGGGAWLVMSAYNSVNGATMSESPLLAEPLKGEWGFDGAVVSDWTAVRSTEASASAAQDLVMPGPSPLWGPALVEAVQAGRVPAAAVEDKARRLLRLAWRVGALDAAPAPPAFPTVPNDQARRVLRKAAAAAMVLLRNDDQLLPLDAQELRTVALLGPSADTWRVQGGGSAEVFPAHVVTPLQGLREALGPDVDVRHVVGASISTALAPVTTADVIRPVTSEPGLTARYLSVDGRELAAEHRTAGRLVWAPEELPVGTAVVEVAARLRVDETGRWCVGVGGTGHHTLVLDGATVFDGVIAFHGDDIATVNLAPPYADVDVDLVAGQLVDVVARHRVGTALFGVSLSLAVRRPQQDGTAELERAVRAAREADVAVVVVGTTTAEESEGADRERLSLPGRQDELVRAVAAANPRTVVVVNSGGPVELPWATEVPALLLAWFPGQEGGAALADVLTGAAEPAGRMPTTWAQYQADAPVLCTRPTEGQLDYAEGLHVGYRAWLQADPDRSPPSAWFGHGLGYTRWEYATVHAPVHVRPGEPFVARVRVRNVGPRRGAEVVQVYLSRPGSALERAVRWLAGFARAAAAPGEAVEVDVHVPARALQHWDGIWRTEPGEFRLHVGRSVVDLRLERPLTVDTERT